MAKLKEPELSLMDRMALRNSTWKENHPVVDTNYRVLEHSAAYTHWADPYDDEIPARSVPQTDWLATEEEAQDWISKHDPDLHPYHRKPNVFIIEKRYSRLIPEHTEWFSY